MIDFTSTSQNEQNLIEFYNNRMEVVKTYPLGELEGFITNTLLNLSYEWVEAPNGEPLEQEVYEPVSEYIDREWDVVTKDFYLSMNPSEFKSNNGEQKTRKQIA